jgi:hypothetical protein
MFVSFSTTRVIIEKNKLKEEQIEGLNLTHEPSARNLSDTEEFGKLMFSVWGSMIRGDFDNDADEYPGYYIRICGVCIVFMANVILLNLLVAVLGDAYDQVNSNQNELLLIREKILILRQEAFF